MPVPFEAAFQMIVSAHRRAAEIGVAVSVVIVDEGGNVRASGRMDDASPVSLDVAETKAMNSAYGGRDGADYVELHNTRPATIAFLNQVLPRPISPGLGGRLIRIGDRIVGAIGISGGTGAEDDDCARAALRALEERACHHPS